MRGITRVILAVAAATLVTACSKKVSVERCEIPVHISFGQFDHRFGVTEEEFHQAAHKAASLWNDVTRGEAIIISADGIPINFVYDERQARANALNTLDELKTHYQDALDSLKAAFKHVKGTADAFIEQHNAMRYNEDFGEVQTLVDISRVIIGHQQELIDNEYALLRFLDDEKPDNEVAGSFTRGEENKVEVFLIQSYQDLVMLLAHEFGHAIGVLEHVDTPKSVMYETGYPVEPEQVIKLTEADLEAYRHQCG